MTLASLAILVCNAVERDPPPEVLAWCAGHYRPYYHLLHLLADRFGGPCVELGVEKGRGCAAMLAAGAAVWGVDHARRAEIAALEAAFPRFRFLERDSLPVPGPVENLAGTIRVLHIDTEHSYAMAREEFWAYKRLLATPSAVCFDDVHAQDSQVGHFVSSLAWPTVLDDRLHECGYAVMLYDGER